jgi:hypothetical protein
MPILFSLVVSLPRTIFAMSPRGLSLPLIALALLNLIAYRAQALNSNVNFTALCEESLASLLRNGTYNQSQPLLGRLECGASYDETTPPALSINISLPMCLAKAPGYQRSRRLSEWGTPLIAFLLPAVAFILTVGRPKRLPKFEYLIFKRVEWKKGRGWTIKLKQHGWAGLMLVLGLLLTVISVTIDTILWGIIIFVLAGPVSRSCHPLPNAVSNTSEQLIAGSSFKAINDFIILRYLQRKQDRKHALSGLDRYLMAVTLVGTFEFGTSGLGNIVKEKLRQPEGANRRLLHLINQVPSFGIPIFGPVLFFLGIFVEGLYDARDKKGDNNTANSIAFGIWYGVIVVVAIFAAATIGVEDPFTIENVFGGGGGIRRKKGVSKVPTTSISRIWQWLNTTQKYLVVNYPGESKEEQEEEEVPFAYFKSPYVTVWIGQRHISFREWINNASSFPEAKTTRFYSRLLSSGMSKVLAFITAIVIVGIPCGLAASTSYFTPTASRLVNDKHLAEHVLTFAK